MKYSTEYKQEKMARARGTSLSISFKQSVEVCRMIRNKKYSAATTLLQKVEEMKDPVPYRKFNKGGVGHRKGLIGPGRFPVKTSKSILEILKSAYSNADQKGLDTSSLKVCSAIAKKGPKTMKYGRIQGRRTKRTHIEITLSSSGVSKKPAAERGSKKTEKSFADLKVKTASKGLPDKHQKEQEKTKAEKSGPSSNAKTKPHKEGRSPVKKETPAKEDTTKPTRPVKNEKKASKTNKEKNEK